MTVRQPKHSLLIVAVWGTGVFNVGAAREAWRGGRTGRGNVTGLAPRISFALVPFVPHMELLRVMRSGTTLIMEMNLPMDEAGAVLRCRIELHSQDRELSRFRRRADQTANSALAIAAMTLLLAVCGWIVGGTEGVHRALAGSAPQPDGSAISRETIHRWFGARLLSPAELPELFNILAEVCNRARLSRLPDLYCVAAPGEMNAYALGGPGGAAIVLTEGLLRGMTRGERVGALLGLAH